MVIIGIGIMVILGIIDVGLIGIMVSSSKKVGIELS
jgi:hypothetical protein